MEANSVKILVIDDNIDNLTTIKAVINELFPQATVLTSIDGKKGIDLALEHDPDIILLDIIMPEIDGFEVCRRMKSNKYLKNIPVVFLTAVRGDKSIRIKALEVGAEGFLTKPIDEPELIAQINAMLKIKAANNDKETEKERLAILVEEKTKELRESNKKTLSLLNELKSEMQARENTELALQDSEHKFREIIETTNDIHFRQNIDDYSIDYFSPSVYQILGYTIDEIIEMRHEIQTKLFHPEDLIDLTDIKNDLINTLNRGEKFIEREFRMICKNKDIKWINGSFYLTLDINNKPVYLVGTLRDISEKKKNENEIILNNIRLKGIINILQSNSSSVQEFLDFSLNEAIKLTESQIGYIYWYNSKKKEFILNSWSKHVMTECGVINPQTCYELDKTGIWGEAVRQRKPIIVNNFKAENSLKKGFPEGHIALNTFMTIPIFNLDEIIGVVGVANKATDYTETDVLQLSLLMNSVWKETERKSAEERYEKLFLEMFDGFALHEIILDENGNAIDYKFLDVNPAFEKITGLKKEEIIGKNVLQLMPDTEKYWIEKYGKVALNGEPILYDNFSVELGKYFEVRAFQPTKNQFATIISDISYRKKNEIANKVQYNIANAMVTAIDIHELYTTVRNELSKLIDTTNFIIALYDEKTEMLSTPYEIDEHDEGILDEWSAEKSLTGLVVKNKKSLLLSKSDIAKLATDEKINLIGSRAECWLGVPMQIDEKVIGAIVIQSYNNPNAYNNESISNLEIIAHELSIFIERKNTEEQLISAKERAEESDRLKTAFLQNMSHEIRTPLNGILGFASLLTDDELIAEDVKKYATMIQNSGNRLFELINNIIDISKIESGNITIIEKGFSIDKLLDDILNQFIINAEIKNIELRKIKNETHAENYIISDSLKIHQILTNLINNSLKFIKKGFVEVGYSIIGNEIEFYVKDTGSGIPKEIGEKIFERFFQADTSMSRGFEGAGLGLSICQGLTNALKGKIWLESEVDKGTIFYIKIPIKISKITMMEKEKKTPLLKLNHNTILIAEDDDTSYALLEMILNKAHLEVIRAINGLEAVEITKNKKNISCILMDIKMPVMNGIEATKQIKAFRPDLPIIAQTAYAFQTEREQVIAAGCNDYLTKPISKQLLMHLLDKHVKNNITLQ
jgi:PAS domain S-box-containing protein